MSVPPLFIRENRRWELCEDARLPGEKRKIQWLGRWLGKV